MAQTHLDIDTALKAEQERLTSRKQELETELSEINSRLFSSYSPRSNDG